MKEHGVCKRQTHTQFKLNHRNDEYEDNQRHEENGNQKSNLRFERGARTDEATPTDNTIIDQIRHQTDHKQEDKFSTHDSEKESRISAKINIKKKLTTSSTGWKAST
jgi:hypothetical protein